MPTPHHDTGRTPARLEGRATWLVSRAYTRSSGLLSAGFEAHGSGLRGYHYRLLAALEEWGPEYENCDIEDGRGTALALKGWGAAKTIAARSVSA